MFSFTEADSRYAEKGTLAREEHLPKPSLEATKDSVQFNALNGQSSIGAEFGEDVQSVNQVGADCEKRGPGDREESEALEGIGETMETGESEERGGRRESKGREESVAMKVQEGMRGMKAIVGIAAT